MTFAVSSRPTRPPLIPPTPAASSPAPFAREGLIGWTKLDYIVALGLTAAATPRPRESGAANPPGVSERAPTRADNPAAPRVRGKIGGQGKAPWRNVEPPHGPIEREFLRPLVLGETIAPFRLLTPALGVVPIAGKEILDVVAAAEAGSRHSAAWLRDAEAKWGAHARRVDGTLRMTLLERVNHMRGLSAQIGVTKSRLVYAKAGTLFAATVLEDHLAIVDHMAYWAPLRAVEEGRYLSAILNCDAIRRRIAPMQPKGQGGARHFDNLVWELPIPEFDRRDALHAELAEAAAEAEEPRLLRGKLRGVLQGREFDVLRGARRLRAPEQDGQRVADPRDHHRPALDAAERVDALLERRRLQHVVEIQPLRLGHEAVDDHRPRPGPERMGEPHGIALVGAELVEVVVAGDVLERVLLLGRVVLRHGLHQGERRPPRAYAMCGLPGLYDQVRAGFIIALDDAELGAYANEVLSVLIPSVLNRGGKLADRAPR